MDRARLPLLLILIAATSGSVARSQDVLSDTDHEDDVVSLLQSAMRSRVALGHDRKGNTVLVHHCSHAAEGCERRLAEFARYLVDAGQAYGIDPWLMAAMAFKESGLNPFAQGAKGELGILQIHPKRRDARQVRFIRDGWYRMRCHKEAGACQREVVRHAAHVLARSIELCGGDVKNALGLYNTGRCGGNHGYAKSVLFELGQLRRVVGLEVQAARAQERS